MLMPVDSLENRSQKSFKTGGSPGAFTGQTSHMEPEHTKPDDMWPGGVQPHNAQPDDARADGMRPDVQPDTRPDAMRPDDMQPDRMRPDDAQPNGTRPDDARPDRMRPDDVRPNGTRADDVRPDCMRPEQVVATLGLRPLPVEGGLWAQTWRDENCTAIYYMLVDPAFSALHRLRHPEIWVYHAGAPARLTLIDGGSVTRPILGPDLAAGQRPQVVVPAGTWQGCRTLGEWSLLGTFMAPPYTDDAVEFAVAGDFPGAAEEIRALCAKT